MIKAYTDTRQKLSGGGSHRTKDHFKMDQDAGSG